jgi:uncharacterized protein
MKIMVISDEESRYLWDYIDIEKFKDIDLIISCGDLKAEYLSFLVTVLGVPLFYIRGNHDGSYIKSPPEGCDCIDDKLIKYKDVRILGLGGSKRYNEGNFQFTEGEMRRRIKKLRFKLFVNKGIDILVTHSGGYGIGDDTDQCHQGFKSFNKLVDKYMPKYFLHGHTHLNYNNRPRIIYYKETTVINGYGYYIMEY